MVACSLVAIGSRENWRRPPQAALLAQIERLTQIWRDRGSQPSPSLTAVLNSSRDRGSQPSPSLKGRINSQAIIEVWK